MINAIHTNTDQRDIESGNPTSPQSAGYSCLFKAGVTAAVVTAVAIPVAAFTTSWFLTHSAMDSAGWTILATAVEFCILAECAFLGRSKSQAPERKPLIPQPS